MLSQHLKLNTKLFNSEVEKKTTRRGFEEAITKLGGENPDIIAITADLKDSVGLKTFAERYPERFIEVGVAEQNMAGVASGIASMGKIPFMASYAIFSPGRNWEQIRTTICYNDQPVKIIGSHTGVTVGPDGGSHQALEDIAITRVLPNMVVLSPCDKMETKKAILACALTKNPTYIRLTRNDTPIITTEETPFEIGKAEIFYTPEIGLAHVGIIATGPILHKAILTARELEKEGIKSKVLNLSTIKPLDKKAIVSLAKETRAIVTVEDHQISGGMGSAVAELLAQEYPVPIEFVGVEDKFGQSGTPLELEKIYQLDESSIIEKVKKAIDRRKN
jgi:transketolase